MGEHSPTGTRLCVSAPNWYAREVEVEGARLVWLRSSQRRHYFVSPNGAWAGDPTPLYLKAIGDVLECRFAPPVIRVNGSVYQKHLNGFYLWKRSDEARIGRFFDMLAREYESLVDPRVNRFANLALLRAVTQRARPQLVYRVVDWGIGTAISADVVRAAKSLPAIELNGVDVSAEMIQVAARRGVPVQRVVNSRVELPSCGFDGIVACFVVHYFLDARPFREMFRLLRPGGALAFNLHRRDLYGDEGDYSEILHRVGFRHVKAFRRSIDSGGSRFSIRVVSAVKPYEGTARRRGARH